MQVDPVPTQRCDGSDGRSQESTGLQPRGTERSNPFYGALLLFSVLFTFAAFLYLATDLSGAGPETPGVAQFMARHGTSVLLGLGACILVTTLASMALDSHRWRGTKRVVKRR